MICKLDLNKALKEGCKEIEWASNGIGLMLQ